MKLFIPAVVVLGVFAGGLKAASISLISVTHVMQAELDLDPAVYTPPHYQSGSISNTSNSPSFSGGVGFSSQDSHGGAFSFQNYTISNNGLIHYGDIGGFLLLPDSSYPSAARAYSHFEMIFGTSETVAFELFGSVAEVTYSILDASIRLSNVADGSTEFLLDGEVGGDAVSPPTPWLAGSSAGLRTWSGGVTGVLSPGIYSLSFTYELDYGLTTDGVWMTENSFRVSPVPDGGSSLAMLAGCMVLLGFFAQRRREQLT